MSENQYALTVLVCSVFIDYCDHSISVSPPSLWLY